MIIVVLGGSEQRRSDVISQLMQGKISLIQHLNIEPLAKLDGNGLLRLQAEFPQSTPKLTNLITVVSGVTSQAELDFLRTKNALICHCYGQLSAIYDHIKCQAGDCFVMPEPILLKMPEHIYTPSEILSECYFRG